MEAKCLIIVHSYHHNNTAKIADAFSEVLYAKVMTPETTILEDLQGYDVVGFGAGIDSGVHYKPLIEFVDKPPNVNKKVCFIFSTSAIQGLFFEHDTEIGKKLLIDRFLRNHSV